MSAVAVSARGGEAELLARRPEAWPLVSVTIVAYNRRDALRVTLDKVLRELDYPALEVIVVDNASADGTREMLAREFPGVRVLAAERNLGAPAWNRGFAAGRGAWSVILDDDCYLEGDGLKRAVAAAEAHDADLVSFRVRSSVAPEFFFNDDYPPGLLAFWGCCALVSRRATDRLGGYDPNLFIWANEVELTMRFLDAGWRHLFCPEVVAVHMKPPPEEGFSLKGHRVNYQHWAYTAGKGLQPVDAARVLGRLVARVVVHAALHSPRVLGDLPGLLAFFARGLRHRRPVRPAVSALYRDGFHSWASPLEDVAERAGLAAGWRARRAAVRARLYPERRAVLGV